MDFSIVYWRYIMKKIIAIGVILILLVVGGSYLMSHPINSNDGDNVSQSVEYSKNGITLFMPGNWVAAESQSNDTVLAVADPNSKDSSGFNSVNVNIERKSTTGTLESEFDQQLSTFDFIINSVKI